MGLTIENAERKMITCPCGKKLKGHQSMGVHARACKLCDATFRFHAMTDKRGPDECWPWKGGTYNAGYGSHSWRGKKRGANRVAWEIANGRNAPDDLDVLHSCDTPLCVNPAHLRLGTHKENMLDKVLKGRHPTKLTPQQVLEIRAADATVTALAKKYGVTAGQISGIRRGEKWKYLLSPSR